MELQITKQTLPMNELAFDSPIEQPVECDVLLPDYCPDIQRILSCDVCCLIREAHAEQQRLTISGELRLNILYVSDSGMLRGIDHKLPFVRHLDSNTTLHKPMIEVSCKVDYLNCRAISSRRLELRGAVTLRVQAVNCGQTEVVEGGSGLGLQLKQTAVNMDACCWAGESSFDVHEELELNSHPPIAQILSSQLQAVLSDHKVISGKIVCKGELKLKLLYLPLSADEKELPQELEYSLPISQILPAEGAGEGSGCCLSLSLCGWELQPKTDGDGEMKLLSLDAQVEAAVAVHQPQQLLLAQDCYSTVCEVNFEEKALSFLNFHSHLEESCRIREMLEPGFAPQAILSSWAKVKDLSYGQNSEGLLLQGNVLLSALLLDEDGCPQLCETAVQVEHSLPMNSNERAMIFGLQLLPLSTEATINGTQLELRCQLQLSGCVFLMERQSAISAITADESCPKKRGEDCGLCIYYADQKESVWDIAKKYNSSVSGIREENGLEHDILPQRTMLLIPMC